jgi:hypothetical protein
MTVITRPSTDAVRRATLRDLVRRSGAGIGLLARRLWGEVVEMAAAGQLGPDAETEMGRWTGARV